VKLAKFMNWAGLAALGLVAGLAVSGPAAAMGGSHGEEPVGVALDPLFKLTAHTGGAVTRADLRRKPFIVLFGYTNCADVCPTSLFTASNLLSGLGKDADRLRVLFVTVDPERDTPETLKTYLESFDSRIIGLSGSREQIEAVEAAFEAPLGKDADKGGRSHSSAFFLMDKYGLLAKPIDYTEPQEIENMAKRLLKQ
jgi:protein SCO1/2